MLVKRRASAEDRLAEQEHLSTSVFGMGGRSNHRRCRRTPLAGGRGHRDALPSYDFRGARRAERHRRGLPARRAGQSGRAPERSRPWRLLRQDRRGHRRVTGRPPHRIGRESGRARRRVTLWGPDGEPFLQCPMIFARNSRVRSLFGLSKNSRGEFCSTIWPWSMKMTRSATALAKPISCVTHSIVMP